MKERILTGWSFTRVLYLILGGIIMVQSIVSMEWLGIVIGAYFSSMGLFAFGCASGNCFRGSCEVEPQQKTNKTK
jgi:hypothetical protein